MRNIVANFGVEFGGDPRCPDFVSVIENSIPFMFGNGTGPFQLCRLQHSTPAAMITLVLSNRIISMVV